MRVGLTIALTIGLGMTSLTVFAQERAKKANESAPKKPVSSDETEAADEADAKQAPDEASEGEAASDPGAEGSAAESKAARSKAARSTTAESDGTEDQPQDAEDQGEESVNEGEEDLNQVEPGGYELPAPKAARTLTIPSPGEADEMLAEQAPSDSDPMTGKWKAPDSIFTLHGYFRVRPNLWSNFDLGRSPTPNAVNGTDPPFQKFTPIENRSNTDVAGGCGDAAFQDARCNSSALTFANMRMRLMPQLNLGEDVRIKAWFDVFDNLVLGSTPDGYSVDPASGSYARSPFGAPNALSTTQVPPYAGRNSLQDSIIARRAWAEVRSRSIGELRFGRMGFHWGLGMQFNGGEGIDDDFSTEVDRIMAITKIAGIYGMIGYDFLAEGLINQQGFGGLQGLPFDAGLKDDTEQFMLAVAKRATPEEQKRSLDRGDAVFNAGALFLYRTQYLSSEATASPFAAEPIAATVVRRNAEAFQPDIWAQFLYEGLRVELEASMIAGGIENKELDTYQQQNYGIMEFGFALETEYRLLDDKLGLYFNTGVASGDRDVEGLDAESGYIDQLGGDDTVSTFAFHPNYRIDLILWRNIMQRVAGAYYFKPGVSYDFIRSAFGQLLGARLDVVWSRAVEPLQTWGNADDLGLEIDASLYYRSEDGPEFIDGFYAMLQFGYLFALPGLGYLEGEFPGGNPDLKDAQALRGVLGVMF